MSETFAARGRFVDPTPTGANTCETRYQSLCIC